MNILRGAVPVLSAALLLSCGGGGGGSDGGGGNHPPATPPIVTLRATPGTVGIGGTTTLSWTSSPGTTSCEATQGWFGVLPVAGSMVSPEIYQTAELGVRCTNAAGSREQTALINVRTPELTLTATPQLLERGQSVTVRWRAKDMQYCQGNWSPRHTWPMEGSDQVEIDPDSEQYHRVFIMECGAGGISMRRTAAVSVKVLSGTVLMPHGIGIEGDVNDPDAPLFVNDTPDQAQGPTYLDPMIGYVNQPLSGPEGRSYLGGDVSDFTFTTSFEAGDVAFRLTLPGVDLDAPVGERADADLYVYDSHGNLLDASVGSGQEESVVVPGGDSYFVEVRAVTGAVTYLLETEPSPEALGSRGTRLSTPFVVDEAVVIVDATGKGAYKSQEGTDFALSRLGLARKAGSAGRELRVALPAGRAADGTVSPRGTRMTADQRRRLTTLLAVKALEAQPGVRAASMNRILRAEGVPNDPLYAGQRWHYELIGLPQAWDITTGSPQVTVAVVDTGVVTDHPDLASRLSDGYDMVSDPANADGDGLDADPNDPGSHEGSGTYVYHGTHVAGTIGALSNNGVGVTGVNWRSVIMPVRVLDETGSGTTYDILQGVRYAAGLPNDSGILPSKRADIINLSLGASGECESVEQAVYSEVRDAGVTVVASGGNDRSNGPHTPSSCPGVFSVGAVGGAGERAFYSNFGPYIDLAAPGGDPSYDADRDHVPDSVLSTHASGTGTGRTPDYELLYGTSMAAPHVAGVFSLMKSVAPSLTPGDFERILASGSLTDDPLQHFADEVGHGVLDAVKAVRAARGDFDGTPHLVAMPTLMTLRNPDSLGLSLSNSGGGILSVTAILPSASWIKVHSSSVDANGLGNYNIVVDIPDLPFGGTRNGSISIETNAGTRTIPVLVADTFGYSEFNGDIFPIYVMVVDAETGALAHRMRLPGSYAGYRVDDLAPGRYFISAGTDINNDGDVCDAGELCGEHPFYGLHEALEYVDTSEGIDVPLVPTAKQQTLF